jgi:hypothetical protein
MSIATAAVLSGCSSLTVDQNPSRLFCSRSSATYSTQFGRRLFITVVLMPAACPRSPRQSWAGLHPIKRRTAQGNGGSIQTQQLVLETELASLLAARMGHHVLTLLQQLLKHRRVQLLGPVLVDIHQGGTSRRGRQSQMLQLSFRSGQRPGNFVQRCAFPALTKQHGHELPPARETRAWRSACRRRTAD